MHYALEKQMFKSSRKPRKRTRLGRKKRIDNSIRGGKHPVMKSVVRATIFIEEDRLDNTPIASKKYKQPSRKWSLTGVTIDLLVEKVRTYLNNEGHLVPDDNEIRTYIRTILQALNTFLRPVHSHVSTTSTEPRSQHVEIYTQRIMIASKDAFASDIEFTLHELGYGPQSDDQHKEIRKNVLNTRDSVFDAMTRWKHGEAYPIPQPNIRRKCHCEVIYRVLKYHQVETTRKGVGEILSKLAKQPPHGLTVAPKWRSIAEYVITEVY